MVGSLFTGLQVVVGSREAGIKNYGIIESVTQHDDLVWAECLKRKPYADKTSFALYFLSRKEDAASIGFLRWRAILIPARQLFY